MAAVTEEQANRLEGKIDALLTQQAGQSVQIATLGGKIDAAQTSFSAGLADVRVFLTQEVIDRKDAVAREEMDRKESDRNIVTQFEASRARTWQAFLAFAGFVSSIVAGLIVFVITHH